MEKVLFVVPPYPNRISEYLMLPSIEVCIIAQILIDAGYAVTLVDMKIDNLSLDIGLKQIELGSPDYVVIEDDPKSHCNSVALIKRIKDRMPTVKLGIRGEIASLVPALTLERNPGLDFILRFDDDYSLIKVIRAYSSNTELRLIPNIAFRNPGVVVTPTRYFQYKLDSLPMPFRRLYDIPKYLKRDSETIVKSSRGCPGSCLFCVKTKVEQFQLFSIGRFCDEIEELLQMGFKSFFFSDDTFAFSETRLDCFCKEIKKRNLSFKWTSNMRIKDITENKIALMKNAGAYRVFVGIETLNSNTQSTIKKGLNKDLIAEKIGILHRYNMEFHTSFILGNPGDTEDDINKTIDFVNEINPTLVTYNLLKVFPGLELYEHPEKYGIVLEDPFWYEKEDWSYRVVAGTKELPPSLLERLEKKCLRSFIEHKMASLPVG